MRTVFIYALCEPGTRTVRYIGKTTNLKKRLNAHINCSSKARTHLGCWLTHLASVGEIPNMVQLSEVPDDLWQTEEIRYIAAARALGMNLVNSTAGGEGADLPPDAVARGAEKRRGRVQSPSTVAKRVEKTTGMRRTPETRARMSAAQKGRTVSPEHRQKIRVTLKNRSFSSLCEDQFVLKSLNL